MSQGKYVCYSYSIQTYYTVYTIHTHKNAYSFSCCCSAAPYLSLSFPNLSSAPLFFCRKENPKGFENHAHKFPHVLILLVLFGRFASMCALLLFPSTWNFLCKPFEQNLALGAGSSLLLCFDWWCCQICCHHKQMNMDYSIWAWLSFCHGI